MAKHQTSKVGVQAMTKAERKAKYPKGGGPTQHIVCDELVDFVVNCLGMRYTKSGIKQAIAELGQQCTPPVTLRPSSQTIEKLITAARNKMINRVRENRGIHKGDALAFLESIIANPNASWRDKLGAQQQLTELSGLAHQHEIEERRLGLAGALAKAPDEQAQRILAAMNKMDETIGDAK